jgi:Uma2 family endonuclease
MNFNKNPASGESLHLKKEVYGTMALDHKSLHTTKEIAELPDGVRAELINGQIYYMAAPGCAHQALLRELSFAFISHQKANNGNCRTFFAPCAVFPAQDEYNYIEPDLFILCPKNDKDDRLRADGCHGGPDFVLEIVSPSSKTMDYITKLGIYAAAGVQEYWIVDPETERVVVYDFAKNTFPTQYTFSDTIPVGLYPGFSIDFRTLDF